MVFALVDYEKLKTKINYAILEELDSHGILNKNNLKKKDDVAIDKLKKMIEQLNTARKVQCDFLIETIELLENKEFLENKAIKLDNEQKSRILQGAACFVIEQISDTYKLTSKDNSVLLTGLQAALGIDKANFPDEEDYFGMYTALKQFMSLVVFKKVDNKTKPDTNNHYRYKKAPQTDIISLIQKIEAFEISVIKKTIPKEQPGSFWNKTPPAAAASKSSSSVVLGL